MRHNFSIDVLHRCFRHRDLHRAERLLDKMACAQVAPLLEVLTPGESRCAFELLMSGARAQRTLDEMPRVPLAKLLSSVDDALVCTLLERLHGAQAARVMALLEPDRRVRIRTAQLARARAFTRSVRPIASLMTSTRLSFGPETTAREVLVSVQGNLSLGPWVYVVDAHQRLLGMVSLSELLSAPADAALEQVMQPSPARLESSVPVAEVAQLMQQARVPALPVVDPEGHLLGEVRVESVRAYLEAPSEAGTSETSPPLRRFLTWCASSFSLASLLTLLHLPS